MFNLVSTVTATCSSAAAAALTACTGAWHYSTPCVHFAVLVTLGKVSVASVFKFPKGLSTEPPLFGMNITPSKLVLSENLLQVHPM